MTVPFSRILARYQQLGSSPADDPVTRLKKASLLLIPLFVGPLSLSLTLFYAAAGHIYASLVPFAYCLISAFNIWHISQSRRLNPFVFTQLSLVLVLPFLFTWLLGGFSASSFVCIWAIYAPIGALIFQSYHHAMRWFSGFLLLLISTAFIDRLLAQSIPPPPVAIIELFTVLNFAISTIGILFILQYFMREQEKSADAQLQKKHHSLLERTEELKQAHRDLQQLAHHDPLTQLANRTQLSHHLNSLLSMSSSHFAIFFIDLDKFKQINDNYGHTIGDNTLLAASKRLQGIARAQDFIARFGGDEFILVATLDEHDHEPHTLAQRILAAFSDAFIIGDFTFHITTSIGIAVYPDHGTTSETLLKHADTAMYSAKHHGRNNFCYYTEQLSADVALNMEIDSMLRQAIEQDSLSLHYQVQIDSQARSIYGIEALLRWHPHQYEHAIPPTTFIPIAEENGQIYAIGRWVIQQACEFMMRLLQQGHSLTHISVNVSGVQFMHEQFTHDIDAILKATGLPSHYLELELTESMIMNDRLQTIETLQALSERGIALSIDDFGTGYSSLSYLKSLPIDTLKIDRSFIRDICIDDSDKAIVATIIALGQAFNLRIIAEGVENQAQLAALDEERCYFIQGFLFSQPITETALLALLNDSDALFDHVQLEQREHLIAQSSLDNEAN